MAACLPSSSPTGEGQPKISWHLRRGALRPPPVLAQGDLTALLGMKPSPQTSLDASLGATQVSPVREPYLLEGSMASTKENMAQIH